MSSQSQNRVAMVARIVKFSVDGSETRELSRKCSLNPSQLCLYLDFLVGTGMLKTSRTVKGLETYKTTRKGEKFLEDYQKIRELLKMYA